MSKQNPARPVPTPERADGHPLQPDLAPAPAADAPPAVPDPSEPPVLDAHGHDPRDFDWYPVLRRPRADGWTVAKQRLFIETLADTASPRQAADAVDMSPGSAYKLRRSPGGEGFAAAWDAAVHQGAKRLVDIALERAVDGVDDPVLDADGRCIYLKRRYNDRLLMFLIRAHLPAYRDGEGRRAREPEPAALAAPPVAQAVALLEPVRPPAPEALVDPGELEDRLFIASHLDGEMRVHHDPTPPEVRLDRIQRNSGFVPGRSAAEQAVDRMLDQVRRENSPHWDPDAVRAQAEEDEALERGERENRRARRAARARRR